MAVITIHAGVFSLVCRCSTDSGGVIDAAEITDLAAVRPAAIVAVIAHSVLLSPHGMLGGTRLIRPVVVMLVAVASQRRSYYECPILK